MVQYMAFGPDAEVLGQSMVAFVRSLGADTIQPLLEAHDLHDIQPEHWYPQQKWLDVFSDLALRGSTIFDFVSVGLQIVHTARIPPDVLALPFADKLLNWRRVFQHNNRGADAGDLYGERVGPQHVRMVTVVPYPDDFMYGVYFGIAQRFLPTGTNFSVYYDEGEPAREAGGERTIIHIEWDGDA